MENKINIHNYEAFLLDYLEGNLSAEDSLLLEAFALAHPELDINLSEDDLVYIEKENTSFGTKDAIKKIPADLVPDELLIGYIENTLSGEEKQHLEVSCASNQSLAKELNLYQRTILTPDVSVVFENKKQLKKQGRIILFSPAVFRAAAAVILLAGLFLLFRNFTGKKHNGERLAALESNTKQNSQVIKNIPSGPAKEHNPSGEPNPSVTASSSQLASQSRHETVKPVNPVQNTPKESSALASNNKQQPQSHENAVSPVKNETPVANYDSLSKTAMASNPPKNNSSYIVTLENDDEENTAPAKEKGFWAAAKRTLSSLNKMGVKKVNGTETVNTEANSETYVLSLGNFSIQKNKYNQE